MTANRDFRWSTALALAAAAFAIGTLIGVALHWPAFQESSVFKEDLLQAPHWAGYHSSTHRADDLFVEYGRFNESPLQNAIYWIGTHFLDMIPLSKYLGVLSYGLLCALFFLFGYATRSVRLGLLMVLCALLIPASWDYSPGFFSKFWMTPVLLACVFCLQTRYWPGFVLLLPFGALAYPMSAVLTGMTICTHAVIDRLDRRPDRAQCIRWVAIGAVLGIGVLSFKYLDPPDFLGPMRSGAELKTMPEVKIGGYPSRYVPIPDVTEDLVTHLEHPLLILCTLLFFFVRGRAVDWKKSWTALLIASLIGYVIADLLFMRLYIPNRYTRHSMLILFILWLAHNWDGTLALIRRAALRKAAIAAFAAVGIAIYVMNFLPASGATDWTKTDELNRFIRDELPSDVLIAGSPRSLDSVMTIGKRSILTPYKMAHPWYIDYYAEVRERTRSTLHAHFAANAEPVNAIHERFGATHFLVEMRLFDRIRREERVFPSPYQEDLEDHVNLRRKFFLKRVVPEHHVIYEDEHYRLIELPVSTPAE